ncbi:beta-glucosidase BglX [Mucilaginibacter ximonensis]|uniref:beta-glucosidase n=1 Tax=Mucilaginibacter ximonensis TaxID=538021 RepID=A0ABW5YCW6_9SPHI
MNKKLSYLAGIMAVILIPAIGFAQNTGQAKMDQFVSALMKKMTLEEKIGQLNLPSVGFDVTGPILSKDVDAKIKKGLVGGVFNTYTPSAARKLQALALTTRLKIPLLFGYDVIHGHRTIFPIPLGLSSSWDLALIQSTARAAAEEASADGINWVFSPMVDLTRDPRWGRVAEGAGEDTWYGSKVAAAMVHGYQGNNLAANNAVMACVKHFALYGAVEAGRDYNVVDMSERKMRQDYLPPYKAAIDAGAGSVMSSFNEINGVPAAANQWLLTDLLRKQWGFTGMVATDYTAIMELTNHGIGDSTEAAHLALVAGNDMDMVSELYLNKLPKLVKTGKLNISYIDQACRRVLEAKYKLGLFADPYRGISEERAQAEIMNPQKLELAQRAAEESMVLLKNKNGTLPLKSNAKIAFVGPLVKDQRNLIGNWSGAGDWKKATSFWDVVNAQYPGAHFTYAKGCNLLDDTALINKLNPHDAQIVLDSKSAEELIEEAVKEAKNADVAVAFLGESFTMSGEAASRSDIGLPANQKRLLAALKKTGKPVVLVLMNGRPLTLSWEDTRMDAIVESWFGGTRSGEALVNTLFGRSNFSGRLTMSFPRSVGQIPIYYNEKSTGRPFDANQKYSSKYLDIANTPLYPFGYGLSYTTFKYGPITLDKKTIRTKGNITATINVTNTGQRDAIETVQLYIRDIIGTVTRPMKELKGFKQIAIKAGNTQTVSFTISTDDLKFYNLQNKYTYEPGDFELMIGPNSQDLQKIPFKVE